MKKLCLTTYVFGEKYQEYIPLFILSIKYSYPDYGVVVFVREKISNEVQKQLNLIASKYEFLIVEGYFDNVDVDFKYGPALRWFMYDDYFLDYDYIYFADVDIIYCQENNALLNQHIEHMKFTNLPFSNVVRKNKQYGVMREFLSDIKHCGLEYTFKKQISSDTQSKRLTGLHFVERDFYTNSLEKVKHKFIDTIIKKEKLLHHRRGFNDESLLFDIYEYLLGDIYLPQCGDTFEYDGCKINSYDFRPHHGIHLGIWRNENNRNSAKNIITCTAYVEYFHKLHNGLFKSKLYMEISKHFSMTLNKEIGLINEEYRSK
ncbi:hypothetical protein [Vibrio cyclitrophicus]|uniref:hypothetical protein n=1 Tax=Vibrio cyclitrophicus TaxID=47951 RepID=UPI0002D25BBA|nr:hypothetical protein [Vibrio cyclitrophicus]OEE10478.1 hypothetical protein OC1_16710 [Vibrio cyclitrophicus ZF207]